MPAKKPNDQRKEAVSVRLAPALVRKAKAKARAENRTFTNFLETILEKHLARLGVEPKRELSILD